MSTPAFVPLAPSSLQPGDRVNAATAAVPAPLLALLAASSLQAMTLAGRRLLPIVQGGMGIGVSAHRLARTVASLGGVGTLSSVDLRRHHPDLMEATRGLIAINIMRAVSDYAAMSGARSKPASTGWWWAPGCSWAPPSR